MTDSGDITAYVIRRIALGHELRTDVVQDNSTTAGRSFFGVRRTTRECISPHTTGSSGYGERPSQHANHNSDALQVWQEVSGDH